MKFGDRDLDVTPARCGTEWRHCPEKEGCLASWEDTAERTSCLRLLAFPESKVLDVKTFEEIDLTTQSRHLRLIVDHGKLRFVRLPRTDRDLLITYEKEYAKHEKNHIAGNYLTMLAGMLTDRGYSTDIVDVRRRLW